MSIKDMKKLIFLCIIFFAFGFGCLILYYVDYSNKTELRSNSQVDDIILNENKTNQEIDNGIHANGAAKGDTKYSADQDDLNEYDKYVQEQLNQNTDASQEEQTDAYKKAMQSIRLSIFSQNYSAAATTAYEATNNNVFHDSNQYAMLSAIKNVNGFNTMSGEDQIVVLESIKDPVIYVALFYSMSPEYQAYVLGNEGYLYIPAGSSSLMSYNGVEEAGPMESRATEFYSDLSNVNISKVKVSVGGIDYNVFVAGRDDTVYRITNIAFEDNSVEAFSSYKDYFEMWGRKPIDYYAD